MDFNTENMVLQRCPEAFKPYKNSGFSVFSVFMLESVEDGFWTPFRKAKRPPFWLENPLKFGLGAVGRLPGPPQEREEGYRKGVQKWTQNWTP